MKTAVLTTEVAHSAKQQRHLWIFSPSARPARFVVAGLASAAVQVAILSLLVTAREGPEWSDAIAIFGGTQASFVLSSFFTWHDQPASGFSALVRRWFRFMAMLSITAMLNEGVFLILYHRLPVIAASLLASSLIALLNYTLGERFIFSH